MSVDQRIFDGIVSDLETIIDPRVKRSLRILIKERKEKEQKITLREDLESLRNRYLQQIHIMFNEIEAEAFMAGVLKYSGYSEPKEED